METAFDANVDATFNDLDRDLAYLKDALRDLAAATGHLPRHDPLRATVRRAVFAFTGLNVTPGDLAQGHLHRATAGLEVGR